MDTSSSIAKIQGAPLQIIMIDKDKSEEEKEIPKEKDQEAIQTLVTFPTTGTPTRMLHKLSTDAMPLQISALGLSSTKFARVLHHGDPNQMRKQSFQSITMKTLHLNR